jgi:hypothetical protein
MDVDYVPLRLTEHASLSGRLTVCGVHVNIATSADQWSGACR